MKCRPTEAQPSGTDSFNNKARTSAALSAPDVLPPKTRSNP